MYLYTGKDGRQRLSFKNESGKLVTVSYPRFIMEQHIGRKLSAKEDVHHIDGNPLNNDISNLKIIPRGEHQRKHSTKYYDKTEKCDYCGNEFIWFAKSQMNHYRELSRSKNPKKGHKFCSKSCCGKFGKLVQVSMAK